MRYFFAAGLGMVLLGVAGCGAGDLGVNPAATTSAGEQRVSLDKTKGLAPAIKVASLPEGTRTAMTWDSKRQVVWVTMDAEVVGYTKTGSVFKRFAFTQSASTYSQPIREVLALAPDGALWWGSGSALMRIDVEAANVTDMVLEGAPAPHPSVVPPGPPNGIQLIVGLTFDNASGVLVLTEGAGDLQRYDKAGNRLASIRGAIPDIPTGHAVEAISLSPTGFRYALEDGTVKVASIDGLSNVTAPAEGNPLEGTWNGWGSFSVTAKGDRSVRHTLAQGSGIETKEGGKSVRFVAPTAMGVEPAPASPAGAASGASPQAKPAAKPGASVPFDMRVQAVTLGGPGIDWALIPDAGGLGLYHLPVA